MCSHQEKTSTTRWLLLKCFHLPCFASTQSGDSNKPLFRVKLAVVRHTFYWGESDNVMLCETYSAYQRFFAVLIVAHWHLFFFPYLFKILETDPLLAWPIFIYIESQCCFTRHLQVFTIQPKSSRNQLNPHCFTRMHQIENRPPPFSCCPSARYQTKK